jgi:aconitate hydratase
MNDGKKGRADLRVGPRTYEIFRIDSLDGGGADTARLPFSLKILLENLLRTGAADDAAALARWDARAEPNREIAFVPSRVLMQDFTGVPAVVDLAAMRDAMAKMGGDPAKINPLSPAELVIDHSVQVDEAGTPDAERNNARREFSRNRERYAFLRWGQAAFRNFKVVPPDTGIVHQVNVEYLARVVFAAPGAGGKTTAYPDTVVGTDSHTTMVNGLGVLGWGVGGIEAEAALLGQPVSMLIPQVVGVRLVGEPSAGSTATDLVLTVTEALRKKGVVGKFVEFFGRGLRSLSLSDRVTVANMAPEYGATCGFFPVDEETLRFLRLTSRPAEQVALVEAYCREQGLFLADKAPKADYSDVLEIDLGAVEPSMAGPKRPQDRVALGSVAKSFEQALPALLPLGASKDVAGRSRSDVSHGSVVIAAITSCTNTSNPSVMIAAGLVAKKAVEKGLSSKPWVKTSLSPGSRVATAYFRRAGLDSYLEKLGFYTVGYGCTTCIGNSGPLAADVSKAIEHGHLVVASVLSGNRNFEGRVHPEVRANYLASPPLVVAYALAGRIDIDLTNEPLGHGKDGAPVFLRDIWPSPREVADTVEKSIDASMFADVYGKVFEGSDEWRSLDVPVGETFAWDPASTYVKHPPYFVDMPRTPADVHDIRGARVLAVLGDSVTTDHISPAGSIKKDSPAGRYLGEHGVTQADYNSYGSRRGNHEVMVRGTFANIRLKNRLAPGTEGGVTRHLPSGEVMSIFDASEKYRSERVPLVILAGKEYGTGSSRDWAAKGPKLLGVVAVIAQSYERIHRSNLVGMGILPIELPAGQSAESLGLTGEETYDIVGLADLFSGAREVTVRATRPGGSPVEFRARSRIDTPEEALYFRHGGILKYVLRQLLGAV